MMAFGVGSATPNAISIPPEKGPGKGVTHQPPRCQAKKLPLAILLFLSRTPDFADLQD
jgi:hypothetical protein